MRAEFPVSSTKETRRSAPLVSLFGSATFEEVRMSEGAGSEEGSRLRLVLLARWGMAVTTSSTLPVDSPAALEAMQVKFPESFMEVTLISKLPLGKTKVLEREKISQPDRKVNIQQEKQKQTNNINRKFSKSSGAMIVL